MTHARAVSLMILVTLLWSIAGVVTRHLDAAKSFEVTFWRSILKSPRAVWISGFCWSVMFTAFMIALTLTSVANVLVIMALGPLVTALFARAFLGHKLPRRTWIAIVVAGIGVAWMYARQIGEGVSFVGSLVALAIPLAGAVNFTTLQHVGHRRDSTDQPQAQDMLPTVFIGAVISALATFPLAYPLQASPHDLGLLALLGTVQLAIPCLLLVRLSRQLSAPEIALLGLLEVVFGVTWTWLWAGEQPSSATLIGGALVLGSLVANELLALRARRRLKAHD